MNELILWRHAEAQELAGGLGDMARALTPRGRRQAAHMARWLGAHLPADTLILCSPAVRTVQTARALQRPYTLCEALRPGASAQALLQAAGWPDAQQPVLIVGHQPTLGQAVAQLLGLPGGECAVRKAAVWWLRARWRDGAMQTVVRAMQTAEML